MAWLFGECMKALRKLCEKDSENWVPEGQARAPWIIEDRPWITGVSSLIAKWKCVRFTATACHLVVGTALRRGPTLTVVAAVSVNKRAKLVG